MIYQEDFSDEVMKIIKSGGVPTLACIKCGERWVYREGILSVYEKYKQNCRYCGSELVLCATEDVEL